MKNFRVAAILFLLGIIGVLSLLTVDIPLDPEIEELLLKEMSAEQIKYVLLINPAIMVLLAVIAGSLTFRNASLDTPIIRWICREHVRPPFVEILKAGIVGGLISGILLSLASLLFLPLLPNEFKQLSESFELSLAARLLYGGITEEIMMRFGLMTLLVWAIQKLSKRQNPATYILAILLSSLIFALGHFPVAYQAVDEPSFTLLTYILIGNSLGGIVFGYLYWKKGLESAMLAHMITHVVMLTANVY
jgi:membrane protease YdiL (CAAX protease family)